MVFVHEKIPFLNKKREDMENTNKQNAKRKSNGQNIPRYPHQNNLCQKPTVTMNILSRYVISIIAIK